MMKKQGILPLKIGITVTLLFYVGAFADFFPFAFIDDLGIRVVAFCMLIICGVIAVCTEKIVSEIRESKKEIQKTRKSRKRSRKTRGNKMRFI